MNEYDNDNNGRVSRRAGGRRRRRQRRRRRHAPPNPEAGRPALGPVRGGGRQDCRRKASGRPPPPPPSPSSPHGGPRSFSNDYDEGDIRRHTATYDDDDYEDDDNYGDFAGRWGPPWAPHNPP